MSVDASGEIGASVSATHSAPPNLAVGVKLLETKTHGDENSHRQR